MAHALGRNMRKPTPDPVSQNVNQYCARSSSRRLIAFVRSARCTPRSILIVSAPPVDDGILAFISSRPAIFYSKRAFFMQTLLLLQRHARSDRSTPVPRQLRESRAQVRRRREAPVQRFQRLGGSSQCAKSPTHSFSGGLLNRRPPLRCLRLRTPQGTPRFQSEALC